jgi:hypothetical protein
MSKERVKTKDALIEHIQRDWIAINHLLYSLSEAQWTTIKNVDGWAIKDHIAHLTAWEQSMIAFLNGIPRHVGLGIGEELYLTRDVDAMNQVIFETHRHDELNAVRSQFQLTHDELLQLILPLTDEALNLPYAHYLPDEPGEGDGPPAISLIYVNTARHYREHQGWIETMLAEQTHT